MGDSRGYYYDGAYTAAPAAAQSEDEGEYREPHEEDESTGAEASRRSAAIDIELREAYFVSLATKFAALRAKLHRNPPAEALDALPKNHETEVGFFGGKGHTFKQWTHRLRYTDPLPAQVAAMDRQSTIRLLRIILGGKFLRRGVELHERTSRWIWALLARLPDRGELDHVEVGWVRELGKRAVMMMVSITHMAALREEIEGDLDSEKFADDEEDFDQDILGDMEPDVEDDGRSVDSKAVKQATSPSHRDEQAGDSGMDPVAQPANDDADDGEANMDLDIEDGEVPDEPTTTVSENNDADIAAVKARLLAQLDNVGAYDEPANDSNPSADPEQERPADRVDLNEEEAYDEVRARVNMRATLNMILTVSGEFYGQRDLLEFRDPFAGL